MGNGILFARKLLRGPLIVLKFCTKHGNDAAVLCAKFQNDWENEIDVMDDRLKRLRQIWV